MGLTISQENPLACLDVITREQLAPPILPSLSFGGQSLKDVFLFNPNLVHLWISIIYVAKYLQSFLVPAVLIEIPWRLRKPEDEHHYYQREHDLAGDRYAPGLVPSGEAHAIIEPVGDDDTDTYEKGLRGDDSPTFVRFAQLRLIHRNSTGLDTRAYTSDEACHHELRLAIGRALEYSAEDDEAHGQPHGLSTTCNLAGKEVDNAAGEGAEVINGNNDAFEGAVRVADDVEEVFVADDAGEDALIIACILVNMRRYG